MARGTSKARIIKVFNDQVAALIEQNGKCAKASSDDGAGRVWMNGAFGSNGWNGDVTDLTAMRKAFDRSEVIDTMNEVMQKENPGTTADKIAMKFQSDYLASLDRAYRTRHASAVRSEIFSASRRSLQASDNLADFTLGQTQRIISRGQS